jgi:hypothetical protein
MNFLNKIPKKNSNLTWLIIEGNAVVVPLTNFSSEERIDIFNVTATRIWELIDSKRTIKQIINQLIKEYETDINTLECQVQKLIGDLLRLELIRLHSMNNMSKNSTHKRPKKVWFEPRIQRVILDKLLFSWIWRDSDLDEFSYADRLRFPIKDILR